MDNHSLSTELFTAPTSSDPYNGSIYNVTDDKELRIKASSTISIFYILIGVFGILGNLIVIIVMSSKSKLRKTYVNMYIVNQSCIDFIVSITVIGLARLDSKALNDGAGGILYCLFWQSRVLLFGFMTSSTYNLLCLTVERYAGVVHPIWHKLNVSHTKISISMAGVWTYGFLFEGIQKFSTAHIADGQCVVYFAWPSRSSKAAYGTFYFCHQVIFPLSVMIYCYVRIAFVLHNKMVDTSNMTTANQTKEHNLARGRRNTIKTLVTVGILFAVCWTWNQINYFRGNLGIYVQDRTTNSYHASVMLIYINCCVNPFIYAFKYKQFQVSHHY